MNKAIKTAKFITAIIIIAALNTTSLGSLVATAAVLPPAQDVDSSIRPQDDFYQYAVGGWLENNPIPPDKVITSSFTLLKDSVDSQLRTILEEAAARISQTPADEKSKIGLLYKLSLDETRRNRQQINPLKAEITRIKKIKSRQELTGVVASLHRTTGELLFSLDSSPDLKNPQTTILELNPGGIGLPGRAYYLDQGEQKKSIRQKYKAHIKNTFLLLNTPSRIAEAQANAIIRLETRLAESMIAPEERRDPLKLYHKFDPAKLQALTPDFNWTIYFAKAGFKTPKEINLTNPDFYKAMNRVIRETPLDHLKAYLLFHLIDGYAPVLNDEFVKENHDFYKKTLLGQELAVPHWQKAIGIINSTMPDALGKEYVKRYYSEESGKKTEEIARNLRLALRAHILQLDWMTPETKTRALKKLDAMKINIGHPGTWKDYSALKIKDDSLAENLMRVHQFNFEETTKKIDKPTDMTARYNPQTVNLWYSPQENAIFIPAAVLQAPFFYPNGDNAQNYGGLGFTIGHEMTHGFDDQGRKFDQDGNLRNWWTPVDEANFKQKTQVLVKQFDRYSPLAGQTVNGRLTLGENIADLGGLSLAIDAFKETELQAAGAGEWHLQMQRFFLSFAQVFRMNVRPETQKLLLLVDPHAPAKFRINGPLANSPDFYKTFSVQANDKMYRPPEQRAKLW